MLPIHRFRVERSSCFHPRRDGGIGFTEAPGCAGPTPLVAVLSAAAPAEAFGSTTGEIGRPFTWQEDSRKEGRTYSLHPSRRHW